MLREHFTEPTQVRQIDSILKAVQRAADLTRKLLAFGRKGKFVNGPVDLHAVIGEVIGLLQHSIDRRIGIRQHLDATPSRTMGDASQLQNALLNLAINARDAMPDGGSLTFSTRIVTLDDLTFFANVVVSW